VTAEEEFVEFAGAVSPRLQGMAFLLCGDWHTAEDLVQAALVKVFVSWRRIRRQETVRALTSDTGTARACEEARAVPLLRVLAARASSRPCRRRRNRGNRRTTRTRWRGPWLRSPSIRGR
jgi:Sigma-70 region 2